MTSQSEDKGADSTSQGGKETRHGGPKLDRVSSGAIYAIATFVCLFAGEVPTMILIAAEATICCQEFFRICRMGGRNPNEAIGLTAAALFPVAAWFYGLPLLMLMVMLLLVAVSCWHVFAPRTNIADVALTAFGPLYTSLTFSCIVLVRDFDPGFAGGFLAACVMLSIWGNDAGAFFVGSRFGKHKMAPKISPNKSWEGFIGGLVGSAAIWSVFELLGLIDLGWSLTIACGLVVGIVSIVGDLFESRLKRGVGVKDSGNIMPGHGGLLDRSDSMLTGGIAAYFLLLFGGVL